MFERIEKQVSEANNFAGRSLTPPEHDQWKDIKKTLRLLLDVAKAAKVLTDSIEQGFASEIRPDIARARLNKALAAVEGDDDVSDE